MYTDSYRDTFATFGIPLRDADACSEAEIQAAETRLGIRLPESLREYYLVAGREKRINQFHDRLLPLEKLFTDAGRVIFMEENQKVVFWGVPAGQDLTPDLPVFAGENRHDKGLDWQPEHDSCFTFLNVMAVWHASFGGAVANTAVGYVDEETTRAALDQHWQMLGDVNAMRAYKQPGRAVCFLKWEDRIQQMRKLPPWRLFAAAASEEELEQLKASLPGEWVPWDE